MVSSDGAKRSSTTKQRKNRLSYLPWGISLLLAVYLFSFLISTFFKQETYVIDDLKNLKIFRHKRDISFSPVIYSQNSTFNATPTPTESTTVKEGGDGIYPPDVFDREKRRQGNSVEINAGFTDETVT